MGTGRVGIVRRRMAVPSLVPRLYTGSNPILLFKVPCSY